MYKLQGDSYELPDREVGERKITMGVVHIDRTCFKKTPEEKLRLKLAKSKAK